MSSARSYFRVGGSNRRSFGYRCVPPIRAAGMELRIVRPLNDAGPKSASGKFAGIGTDKRAWSHAFPRPSDPDIVARCRLPVTDLAPLPLY